jgi:hypothetical protein
MYITLPEVWMKISSAISGGTVPFHSIATWKYLQEKRRKCTAPKLLVGPHCAWDLEPPQCAIVSPNAGRRLIN